MIDEIDVIASTVKQEAEGEPFEGKLGVAFVIVNRMHQQNQSAFQVVYAPWQFSCHNTESPTRVRSEPNLTNSVWRDSYKAATAAYYGTVADPTRGSTSYLNPAACSPTQKKHAGYAVPLVRVTIGRHDFFIAG